MKNINKLFLLILLFIGLMMQGQNVQRIVNYSTYNYTAFAVPQGTEIGALTNMDFTQMMSESKTENVSFIIDNNYLKIIRTFPDLPEYENHFQRGISKIESDEYSTKIYDRENILIHERILEDSTNQFYIENELINHYGTFSEFDVDINIIKDQFENSGFITMISADGILSAINDSIEFYMDPTTLTTVYKIFDEDSLISSTWTRYEKQNNMSYPIIEIETDFRELYSGLICQISKVKVYEFYQVVDENGNLIIDYTTYMENYKSNELKISQYEITNKKISSLKVFPNPATDLINIELPYFNSEYLEILIYNGLGKQVYNNGGFLTGSKQTIDVSALSPGVYIVKVGKGNDWKSTKFIRK